MGRLVSRSAHDAPPVSAVPVSVQRDSTGARLSEAAVAIWRGGASLALSAYKHKSTAEGNANQYVGYGFHLGPGDALRHCSWAALVMGSAISYELEDRAETLSRARNVEGVIRAARARATGVLMAHEETGDTRAADSLMDQHNNGVGMDLAADGYRAGVEGLNEQRLLTAARAALDGGRLKMFHPATGALISTSEWQAFRADASAPDPWASTAPRQQPAP